MPPFKVSVQKIGYKVPHHFFLSSDSFLQNSKDLVTFAINPLLAQVARLSASCPTLNEAVQEPDALGGSLGSSPLHQPPSRKGSGKFFD